MSITLEPLAYVRGTRAEASDDYWGGSVSAIELAEGYDAELLLGLESFSHVEIIFYFHQVDAAKIVLGARHPRNNPDWPRVGILAQRAKNRPNRLGLTTAAVVAVEGRRLLVRELDAIDGTPVLDIKPVLAEFLPRGELRQPAWSSELMRAYWLPEDQRPADDDA